MRFLRAVAPAGLPDRQIPLGRSVPAAERWTTSLRGHHDHRPVLAVGRNSVYASDGWGVSYSSIRFRRFDLQTGKEVASFRSFNGVRCLAPIGDTPYLICATDNKLFRLEATSLEEHGRWERSIPRYADSIAVRDDYVVLANWLQPKLGIVNLESGKVQRRVASPMTLLLDRVPRPLLVSGSTDGGTASVDLKTLQVHAELPTPPALRAALSPDGSILYLTIGLRGKVTAHGSSLGRPTRELQTYEIEAEHRQGRYSLPSPMREIVPGRSRILLAEERLVLLLDLPLGSAAARWWSGPTGHQVVAMDADAGIVLTVQEQPRETSAWLTCWDLVGAAEDGRHRAEA